MALSSFSQATDYTGTTAPVINGHPFCKHYMAAILTLPSKKKAYYRILALIEKHGSEFGQALIKRAWKALEIFTKGGCTPTSHGHVRVESAPGHVHDVDVINHLCTCEDFMRVYTANPTPTE